MASTIGGATTRTGTSAHTRQVSERHLYRNPGNVHTSSELPKKRILKKNVTKSVNRSMIFKKRGKLGESRGNVISSIRMSRESSAQRQKHHHKKTSKIKSNNFV